ncbi:MarR family transcriptional regulator [Pseudonocardia sp. TRM90224]|uniref:MarR family transcriptional regulator n=1 Tax=Pseudonocardia sp. TRM90224 TaxID=2812678 RepID=UPI001E3F3ABD|nr:MarR family transcriptional regulator [Pseudonocardia sp. TRM90224]
MTFVIGVVSHTRSLPMFREAARTLTGVELEWVSYEYEDGIRPAVQQLLAGRQVDGLLLGPLPYTVCRDLLPPQVQVTITRPTPTDLALMFCQAYARGWAATPVSIDTFEQHFIDEVASRLGLDPAAIRCLPYAAEQTATELVDFHRAFLADHPDGLVITMRTAVRQALSGSVRLLNIEKVTSTVRAELHELALRIETERASAQRFAAGVFFVSKQDGGIDLDRARVRLMNLLVETPEFADAWIENRGRRGVVVFAHKALFERITNSWVSVPALGHAATAIGSRVVAGFGVGASARNCVLLAERAAARADQEHGPCGYLVEDSGLIIGPMGPSHQALTFAYREHAAELEQLASHVGLSASTLSRLAAVEERLVGRPIAPSELADSLGITDASGRRLIRSLVAGGLVTPEGTAQAHRKGRPTRLYRLGITAALERKGSP